jgi:hypothetical protein
MNELKITITITHLHSDNVIFHKMALKAVTNDLGGNVISVAMQPQATLYVNTECDIHIRSLRVRTEGP